MAYQDPATIPRGQSAERPGGGQAPNQPGAYILRDVSTGEVVARMFAVNEQQADGFVRMGYQYERPIDWENDIHIPQVSYGTATDEAKQVLAQAEETLAKAQAAQARADETLAQVQAMAAGGGDAGVPATGSLAAEPKVVTEFKVGKDAYTELELPDGSVETRKNDKKINRADFETAKAQAARSSAQGGNQ